MSLARERSADGYNLMPEPGMVIEFEEITDESRRRYTRWLASKTKAEVRAYAERKMMPEDYMLRDWKRARKLLRSGEVKP